MNNDLLLRYTKGFTLIELILVVILLGVIAALSVPNFSRMQKSAKWESDVSQVTQLMRYGQIYAVSHGEKIRFAVTQNPPTFQILKQKKIPSSHAPKVFRQYFDENGKLVSDIKNYYEKNNNEYLEDYEPVTGRMTRPVTLSEEERVEFKKGYIDFYPDGQSDKEELRICRESACYLISTNKQRGHIEVEKYHE